MASGILLLYKGSCWLFVSLLNLSLQTERCKFLEAKVATNKDTIQDLWHCVMPQVFLQHIYIYTVTITQFHPLSWFLIPTNCKQQHRKSQHPPFPGWCEFMNQNNQEKQRQLDCARNSHTAWFFPGDLRLSPLKRKCIWSRFLIVSSITLENSRYNCSHLNYVDNIKLIQIR